MGKLTLAEYVAVCGEWDTAALALFCAWLVEERVLLPQPLHVWERCHQMWARGDSHSDALARSLAA